LKNNNENNINIGKIANSKLLFITAKIAIKIAIAVISQFRLEINRECIKYYPSNGCATNVTQPKVF
jgi:hypothetical protein